MRYWNKGGILDKEGLAIAVQVEKCLRGFYKKAKSHRELIALDAVMYHAVQMEAARTNMLSKKIGPR